MSNLDDTPLVLLVQRADGESAMELFSALQERYDARLQDKQFGPRYKIGPTFLYQGQRFSKVYTFAGSLVMRIVFDTRQGRFGRPIIYRLAPEEALRLLAPGDTDSEIKDELVEQRQDDTNC